MSGISHHIKFVIEPNLITYFGTVKRYNLMTIVVRESMNNDYAIRYDELFPDETIKAEAFDKIARMYYFQNFGTMSKTEMELLLFSIYADRVLAVNPESENAYSEYVFSKELGITKSRVRSLKERKELKYPSNYDWKENFRKALTNAEYVGGKIRLFVKDFRLFTELENVINEMGSYSEATFTRQMLTVSVPVFVDIIIEASEDNDDDRGKICRKLQEILKENDVDAEEYFLRYKTFSEIVKDMAPEMGEAVIDEVSNKLPFVGGVTAEAIKKAMKTYKIRKDAK